MKKVAIDLESFGLAIIGLLLTSLSCAADASGQGPLLLAAETTILATAEKSARPADINIPQILFDETRDTVTEKVLTMKA